MHPLGPSVFTDAGDRRDALRIGGLLAVGCAVLGAVLALLVSRWPASDNLVLVPLLLLVAVTGAAVVRWPDRTPSGVVVATLLLGTTFISVGMVVVGRAAVDGADNEMLLLLPLLYSAYFCRAWVTALVAAAGAGSYGVALLALDAAQPAARWLTTTGALCLVGALVSVVRRREVRRLAHVSDEAGHDALTGLLNRRGLDTRAAGTARGDDVVSLLVVDLDHFKCVNDLHGHAVGDRVLALVADELRDGLRSGDLVARVGGEEFVLVLTGCDAAEALERAEQLRHRVAERSAGWPAPVTLSVGSATSWRATTDLASLLCRADQALYAAKAAGRNTVRSADDTAADASLDDAP